MTDTITEGPYRITSTSESPEQIKTAVSGEKPEEKPDLSKAASELGKEGGKATAEKRAQTAKAAPESTNADPDDISDEEAIAEAEKAEKEGKLGKPRHDPRAKMLQKTREAAELKRTLARQAQELNDLRARAAQPPAQPAAPVAPKPEEAKTAPADPNERPKKDDFADWDEYVEAVADWKAKQVFQKAQEEDFKGSQQAAQARDINQGMQTWAQRMEEAATTDPGFRDKILGKINWFRPSWARGNSPLQAIHVVSDEVVRADNAPALMAHFADHPEEVQRLAALRNPDGSADWRSVQVEMRVLDRTLGVAPTPPAPKPAVSQASDPIKGVGGPPHLADKVPGPDASYEEHKRYWGKRDRGASAR